MFIIIGDRACVAININKWLNIIFMLAKSEQRHLFLRNNRYSEKSLYNNVDIDLKTIPAPLANFQQLNP